MLKIKFKSRKNISIIPSDWQIGELDKNYKLDDVSMLFHVQPDVSSLFFHYNQRVHMAILSVHIRVSEPKTNNVNNHKKRRI